jgi:hypothetical protein
MPPTTSPPTLPPIPAHSSPFLERLILFLLPYFLPTTTDNVLARTEILETLASYGARTRSELIAAAQIIAFSFSALETLRDATAPDMSSSMRLRYRGCANNLNRSCKQNEQTLANSLACDTPDAEGFSPELADDVSDQDAESSLQHAQAKIDTYRNRLSGARPSILPTRQLSPSQQADNNRLWGNAMVRVLADMGMPVQPATASG